MLSLRTHEVPPMLIGKLLNGKLVEIVKVTDRVAFSPEQGWVMIVSDFEKPFNRQQGISWIPASTQFLWVREFVDK